MDLSNLIIEFKFFQLKKNWQNKNALESNIQYCYSTRRKKPENNQTNNTYSNTLKRIQCYATEKHVPYLQKE